MNGVFTRDHCSRGGLWIWREAQTASLSPPESAGECLGTWQGPSPSSCGFPAPRLQKAQHLGVSA